jgi:hypothetical protein
MEHPPYSPYLVSNDFWLFLKMKSALKGRRFEDTENIQINVTVALEFFHYSISKTVSKRGSIFGLIA